MKRLVDLLVASVTLVTLCPVIVGVALLVWWRMGRPILFRQQRSGLHGRPFTMLKFRTMKEASDAQGEALPDEQRLTRLGQFLRRSSLDELPEFFNILRGDMSLVGPRPLLVRYLDRYSPEQARRHEVKPGLTGWAQVNGRNAITWEQKFALDVWYVDHRSFGLDLKIMAITMWKALRREGISQPGHATAEEFMGTAREPQHQ